MIPDQVKALLFLKLTITKNAWMRGQRLSLILGALIAMLLAGAALVLAAGLFALGLYFPELLSERNPRDAFTVLLLLCDGLVGFFLLAWCAALLAELQRSEVIDFRKMLFLPVPLRLVFLLNFVAALISPALLLFMVPLVGLAVGLSIGYGIRMLLVIPLGVAFYFMLAGWTYYVRGLLVFLMENKRRRRTILVIVPMFFAILGQVPALFNMAFISTRKVQDEHREEASDDVQATPAAGLDWPHWAVYGNAAIPLGWFPLGVMKLGEGKLVIPALTFAGLAGLGGGGLVVGYRSTLRHYTGTGRQKLVRASAKKSRETPSRQSTLVGRGLPWLDHDTSAMTFAAFLSYVRHPQIRMQLVFPIVIGLVMIAYFRHMGFSSSNGVFQVLAPLGIALWPVLTMSQFIFNVFGIDPDGYRTLVLLPTNRAKYLIGKNLGLLPATAGVGTIFVVLSTLMIPYDFVVFVQVLAQVVQIYLLFCIIGNFLSIYFPYRIRYQGRQSLQSGGASRVIAMLSMVPLILCGMVISVVPGALALSVEVLLKDLSPWISTVVGLSTTVFFFVLTVLAYLVSVQTAGALLMRREQSVLEALQRDRE